MQRGFRHQEKITAFRSPDPGSSVEIGAGLIKSGFLTQFPGASLPIFMYLAATAAHEEGCTIHLQKLTDIMPGDVEDIERGLNYLEKRDIIKLNRKQHPRGCLLEIDFHPDRLLPEGSSASFNTSSSEKPAPEGGGDPEQKKEQKEEQKTGNNSSFRSEREEEIARNILAFFPEEDEETAGKVAGWLQDFPPGLLEELLSRVDKWLEHPANPRQRAHYYLQAIISDWYEKSIFSLSALKEYDRLYRDTRRLARKYGFSSYKQLNPVQLETLQGWLKGTRALPVEVASLAIEKAVKQKSDGRPSLEYIERNYIKPLKDAGARSTKQAERVLEEKRDNSRRDSADFEGEEAEKGEGDTGRKASLSWEDFLWENNM